MHARRRQRHAVRGRQRGRTHASIFATAGPGATAQPRPTRAGATPLRARDHLCPRAGHGGRRGCGAGRCPCHSFSSWDTLRPGLSGEGGMEMRLCVCCGEGFQPRPQIPDQTHCSAHACQRARREAWRRAKRQNDADYRANQASAQERWAGVNPDYWRNYRDTHPEYTERNRVASRRRSAERRFAKSDASNAASPVPPGSYRAPAAAPEFAKSDPSNPDSPMPSGIYRIVPAEAPEFAKSDAWIAQIVVTSRR